MVILHELYAFVGWGYVGTAIAYMPAHLYGRALARLASLWKEVERHRGRGPKKVAPVVPLKKAEPAPGAS
jgi:hypothetical protein